MPGLTVLCDLTAPIENTLITLLNDGIAGSGGGSSLSTVWRDPHLALLSSSYPEYPLVCHDTPDHLISLEGVIYRAPESPWYLSLPGIVTDLFSGEARARDRAARWIDGMDGDFVIAIQDRRSKDVVILNDFLGRLPLYIHRTDETVMVSRDLSIVTRVLGGVNFDRLAVAEHLLYGYPLGSRTLFSGIERVPPSAAIQIRRTSKRIILSSLQVPSVAPNPRIKEETLEDTARDLSVAFSRACVARVDGSKRAVLGLSGGLDSRSVAAALTANRVPFAAVTRSMNSSDLDVRLAGKVASALQLNWEIVRTSGPTGFDLLRLLRLKSGMNHLGMAFMLPFFDWVTTQHGREVGYLTGDGGDKILPDHRPKKEVLNLETLARYILAKHEVLPLSTAAKLAGVKELDIVAALEERLRSYPEESLDDRHIHFVLFERGFKWLFEGEDRNRHFFWSTSPFYGREPFRLAMGCPARLKARYAFYRHFMESLKGELVDVASTTCGPSLRVENHPVRQLVQTLRKWSPRIVRKSWRRFSRPPVSAVVLDCMREQLAQSSSVTTSQVLPMDANALLGQLERTQAYMLLTLTSTIEYFTTGHSTLARYGDAEFT